MEERMKKGFLIFAALWALTAGVFLAAEGAVRADPQKRPKILKKVNPVYPEEALQQKIEGVVVIEATTDEKGEVTAAKVVPSENPQPLLEEAALAAVRQWKYEPFLKDGKAVGVTFHVTMNFSLHKDKEAGLTLGASKERPKILKKVNPEYPEEAAKQGIEGVVVIEATSNEKGDVVSARVLPSENPQPLLEEAALAAIRQWKYEPFMVKGKAVAVNFTVTMNFALDKEKKQDE
jgi:TonB family protein